MTTCLYALLRYAKKESKLAEFTFLLRLSLFSSLSLLRSSLTFSSSDWLVSFFVVVSIFFAAVLAFSSASFNRSSSSSRKA